MIDLDIQLEVIASKFENFSAQLKLLTRINQKFDEVTPLQSEVSN